MKNIKLAMAIATGLTLISGSVMAEAWTSVIQTTTPGGAVTNGQTNTTGSLQSLNTIDSTTADVDGSQLVTMGANALGLQQTGTTGTSTQAANYAKAATLGSAATAFTQDLTGSGAITLGQSATGTSNVQGVNIIDHNGTNALNAAQTVNTTSATAFTQTSDQAVQTGNGVMTVATPAAGGTLAQNFTTAVLTMGQIGTTNSTQATNYLGARR